MVSIGKRSLSGTIADVLIVIITGGFTLLCFYPFWYILIFTLSDPARVSQGVYLIPLGFSWFNVQQVLQIGGIGQAMVVSLLRTVIGTSFAVLACSFLGYVFTKEEMPFRSFLYRAVIITMYVSGGLIPTFLVYRAYGLTGSFWVYILPGMVGAFNIILVKTFIESLPSSLEEAAIVDGAGYIRVFVSIIFPLSLPIIATIAVFSAVGHWNAFFDTHIYNARNEDLYTLQYLLWRHLNETQRLAEAIRRGGSITDAQMAAGQMLTPRGVRMTITLIATIPIFMVYPFAQRFFIKGIMIGAVKG
jgi:ABC-type glycerol-3-phosphate transport system permease component